MYRRSAEAAQGGPQHDVGSYVWAKLRVGGSAPKAEREGISEGSLTPRGYALPYGAKQLDPLTRTINPSEIDSRRIGDDAIGKTFLLNDGWSGKMLMP